MDKDSLIGRTAPTPSARHWNTCSCGVAYSRKEYLGLSGGRSRGLELDFRHCLRCRSTMSVELEAIDLTKRDTEGRTI